MAFDLSLQDLGNIGEFLGALAVIISLVYLAIQVRYNTEVVRNSRIDHVVVSSSNLTAEVAKSPELARLYVAGFANPDELTPEERMQFNMLLYALFGFFESYYAERDSIDPVLWERWRSTINWYISLPGFQTWWNAKPVPLRRDFSEYIEREMSPGGISAEPTQKILSYFGDEGAA